MSEQYTGQCVGGPDNGNLVTASVRAFLFEVMYRRWLDGDEKGVWAQKIQGYYVWNDEKRVFEWELNGENVSIPNQAVHSSVAGDQEDGAI